MNENHKELISITLTVGIVILALFIVHRFIPSLIWAAIIAVSTYPLYRQWRKPFGRYDNIAAFLFTVIFSLLLLLPLSWMIGLFVKESQLFINYVQQLNQDGGEAPAVLKQLPFLSDELTAYWDKHLGQPGYLKIFLSNLHLSLSSVSYYLKQIGINLAHRSIQLGFTLLILFFFYRDGEKLFRQINHIGEYCLGGRWFRFADKLPGALQSTVNGTILVGIGVGILMGICYGLLGFPAPAFTGFITAVASMIPFVVPFVFVTVALIMLSMSQVLSAFIVLLWGTLVMFVADHFIKPVLIGGAIQLPFLAVLFGILGGVETLGILGLFVGPVVMVLFVTLWQEPQG